MTDAGPKIYRHPTQDTTVIELGPHLRLSLPMTLVAQYGPIHADWTRLEGALDEIYSLLTLGIAPHGGTPLGELLGRKNGNPS